MGWKIELIESGDPRLTSDEQLSRDIAEATDLMMRRLASTNTDAELVKIKTRRELVNKTILDSGLKLPLELSTQEALFEQAQLIFKQANSYLGHGLTDWDTAIADAIRWYKDSKKNKTLDPLHIFMRTVAKLCYQGELNFRYLEPNLLVIWVPDGTTVVSQFIIVDELYMTSGVEEIATKFAETMIRGFNG